MLPNNFQLGWDLGMTLANCRATRMGTVRTTASHSGLCGMVHHPAENCCLVQRHPHRQFFSNICEVLGSIDCGIHQNDLQSCTSLRCNAAPNHHWCGSLDSRYNITLVITFICRAPYRSWVVLELEDSRFVAEHDFSPLASVPMSCSRPKWVEYCAELVVRCALIVFPVLLVDIFPFAFDIYEFDLLVVVEVFQNFKWFSLPSIAA